MGGFDMKNMTKEQREQMQKMMKENGGQVRMMQGGQGRPTGSPRSDGGTQTTRGGEAKAITIQR
jgi:hypothetical protein